MLLFADWNPDINLIRTQLLKNYFNSGAKLSFNDLGLRIKLGPIYPLDFAEGHDLMERTSYGSHTLHGTGA